MRRLVLALLSAAALLLLPATAATADTNIEHNVSETMHDQVPCVGLATITITYNAVEHFSAAADGSVHGTATQTGTFIAVLDAGGTSSGRFTVWDGFNVSADGSRATFTFTFSGTVKSGVGAGTTWHEVSHVTGPLDADGNPIFDLAKVAFDRFTCH
jgi:energy-converting hydrogenase Eha subunit E